MNLPKKIRNGLVLVKVSNNKDDVAVGDISFKIAKPNWLDGLETEHLYQTNKGVVIADTDNDIKKGDTVFFQSEMCLKNYCLWDEGPGYKILMLRAVPTFHKANHETDKKITYYEGTIDREADIYAVKSDGVLYGNAHWWIGELTPTTTELNGFVFDHNNKLIETKIVCPQLNIIPLGSDGKRPGIWDRVVPPKEYKNRSVMAIEALTLKEEFDDKEYWVIDEDDMIVQHLDYETNEN